MTSASRTRRRPRDSEADVETRVWVRPAPIAWDRLMVIQIMQELETQTRPCIAPPNVFLTPRTPADPALPWTLPDAPQKAMPDAPQKAMHEAPLCDTLVRVGRRRRRKSSVPWLLFVMAFGIAFGLGQDRQLRRELGAQLRALATRASAVLHSSAIPR